MSEEFQNPPAVKPPGVPGRRRSAFSEKAFYLEEFYGKSLLFALIPPAGQRLSELDSLKRALRELLRNQTRCILIASDAVLPRVLRRLGRSIKSNETPVFDPTRGLRSRPYPPDSAVAQIWHGLRAGKIVVAAARTSDPEDLAIFAQEMASRLRVFKLVLLDRQGGLDGKNDERISFIQMPRIAQLVRHEPSKIRRVLLRGARRALEDGVASVSLTAPKTVYEELFSYQGTGTLFTQTPYGSVTPISIDDFEEAEALIQRGQNEGLLLFRSEDEIARILPSCFGYRIADEHLAGICSLLTEPYHRDRAGELTALYTLTRFHGEGVGAELVRQVLIEAEVRRLRYVFACTSEDHAAKFFTRLGFHPAKPADVPMAKWRGYNRARIAHLSIFRYAIGASGASSRAPRAVAE